MENKKLSPIEVQEMVDAFQSFLPVYRRFGSKLEVLVKDVLRANGFTPVVVTHRVKDPLSLQNKLSKPDKNYSSLEDVTDLIGLRIMTLLPDEVDQAASIIRSEFEIDGENSVDKRGSQGPTTFGYASLHLICSHRPSRSNLAEYRDFKGFWAEIQIRTILQHAWAEIEHDLGYKAKTGLSPDRKRSFAIIAAGLESADNQFLTLKKEIEKELNEVHPKGNEDVAITPETMAEFVRTSPECSTIISKLRGTGRPIFVSPGLSPDEFSPRIKFMLTYFKYFKIGDVSNALKQNAAAMTEVAIALTRKNPLMVQPEWFISLIGIALAARRTKLDETKQTLQAISVPFSDSSIKKMRVVVRKRDVVDGDSD